MARKRRQLEGEAGELNLTAMIDVAFQLLNFFIMTAHPVAVYAHLDILRPTPGGTKLEEAQFTDLITIMIFKDRFSINTKQVSQVQLEQVVAQLAKLGKNQSVLIQSASDASHQRLITVLNMCAKYGLKNLSVLSM